MTLLKMSLYGAVIILAVLIIRAFTLHKLPKKTFLILWTVALVRLLIPFEIASGFSIYSHLPEAPEELPLLTEQETFIPNPENPYEPFENYADYLKNQGNTQITDDDVVIVEQDGSTIYLPVDNTGVEAIPLPDTETDEKYTGGTGAPEPSHKNTAPGNENNTIDHLQALWTVLWAAGTFLCAAFFLICYLRCLREFRTALPVTEDYASEWIKQHPLKRSISIRQSDKISAPLTYGMFRPVILLPKKTDWTNITRLDYVLYHEFTHIRRFDLLAKLVMIVVLCLHWFNPFVWAMYVFFNRDLELSCDDLVIKHFGEANSVYANTLIDMEERKNYGTPLCNHFSKTAIEERITAIMKSKKTTLGMMVAAAVIIIVVIVTLTTGRKDLSETPENSDADLSVMIEYEEVLTARIQEYLTMMNSCFLNNPPISGEAIPENYVSIADNTGLYPVDEEAFPSYDALIGYVKSICTEEHADELCRRYWLLDYNVLPNIGVLSGKAYTKLFHSTPYPESFEITDIKENIKKYYDTTLSATFRFTEGTNPYYWGVLTFAKQEDSWYVADLTIHRHPMDVSPTPTVSPDKYRYELPPTDNALYYPETNYMYSNEDSLARFDYGGSTVSPKDGYDFTISSFVSAAGKLLLSNVTLNLEAYAGNTAWWCLAAFYDEVANNVYLEFVPAAGVEDAPSGILHVTVPVTNPDEYTLHPAGDFHAQKASAFWFSDICKIQDKIYFNNGSCNGSLWVYDISTGEMSDLTYVNEKMLELARELCADFGWEHDPAIWHTVGWHSYDGIITYKADVCKEMDLGTFYLLRVYYKDGQFLDYSYAYKGAQEAPPTQEELNTQLQELFFRYQDMQKEFFYTNLKVASDISANDWVTINGTGGYTKVLDERFPTLRSVFDYMETICTPQFAMYLRDKNWKLSTTEPVVTEHNGMLYTQCYDGVTLGESYRFFPVNYDNPNSCTLSYEAYLGIPSNKTESGTIYFKYTDGSWHVSNHSYTYYHNYIDDLDLDLFSELYENYRTLQHELFYGSLDCTAHSYTESEEVTINGVDHYYKVTDERFPTLQSVIDYMETICTPGFAKELRKEYLGMESGYPVLAEANGALYTQFFVSTSNEPASFRFTDATIVDSNRVRVGYQGYQNSLINVRVSGTIDFVNDNGWHIDSITTNGGNPYFNAYNGEKLQILKCKETDSGSPNYCNDIIFYRADEGETIEDVLIAMKTVILESLMVPSDDRPFTVTDYDVTVEQPYEQIDISAWRLPVLTGYYSYEGTDMVDFETKQQEGVLDAEGRVPFFAQGSDEVFYFILLEQNGVYRLQREDAATAMLNGKLTYHNPVYEELPASGNRPTTGGPDWFNAVSELMNGNMPNHTTKAEQSFDSNHGDLKCTQPSNENGHVFTISNLVLWEEKNVVLKNVSLDLSTYTTSFIWRENGIYYDEPSGEIYVVFSPTLDEAQGGTGMVEYQVLLATIPQVGSENYTIRCYGNPDSSLNLGGYYTYRTTKIDNLIYLGESRHGDSFYTIDTNTMGLESLSYVNRALYTQAESYLAQCGFGTEFALSSQVVCKTGDYTVFSADVSYSFDNSPTYFTVYHAYEGSELAGKVIYRHQIPFYDTLNESHESAMYITMDDVVTLAKAQMEHFYSTKNYSQPYEITSIHMTSVDTIEVKFLIPESKSLDIYTEATVDFTYDFTKEVWNVSYFKEIPPDYLSNVAAFPRLAATEVTVTGWNYGNGSLVLTYLDEAALPRYQELANAGATGVSEESTYLNIGHWYTLSLNGISYFFYRKNAPINNDEAFAIAITSSHYPLSGGAQVGMTVEELLTLYPDLAKSPLVNEDPVFEAQYGPSMYGFRADQFPPAFLHEYEYAYIALTEKDYPGLPICIAFLIKNGVVSAITAYMPTAN